ncbi:lipopolysaccharide assembly protein LapA domain-containing protein [Streptacidiphilus monticola]|uniref:Lipopolysaccharide assembly protein LapA domain-containing protein n=1 Tax=Streptacidiphilus monticola TaxID=2161674 RepID=A0ABW1FW87_9ACTN
MKRTRFSSAWVGAIVSAVLLVLLLIFIIQNSQKVKVSYLGFNGHISLGVALLLAAAGGVLLVAIPGSARIYQLRRTARRMAQDGKRARR